MIDRHEFLETIFEDRADDETICVSKMIPPKAVGEQPGFWNLPHTNGAFKRWNVERSRDAWYFCVSTMREEWNERDTAIKRKRDNIMRMHCLVLDDIGTKGEPPPVEPSWKLESSEGNFQWGYLLTPTDDIETYEALVGWLAAQGWSDGGAGGAYRIMRLPGSYNLKPGRDYFQSRVTHWDPICWSLADLVSAFGSPDLSQHRQARSVKSSAASITATSITDPVLGWLSDEGLVVGNASAEFVDIRCPWASDHTSGGDTASYSPLGRGAGEWMQFRSFKCHHEHCAGHKFPDFNDWVVKRGGPSSSGYDPLPALQARYAVMIEGHTVVDLEQRPRGGVWTYDLNDWALLYPGKVGMPKGDKMVDVPIKQAFIADKTTRKVATMAYVPSAAEIVTLHGQEVVNTYVEPTWAETDKLPVTFIEHMDYLLPDPGERKLFLDWLAYKVQNPTRRSYAVLMIAEGQGTGRGMIRQRIERMLQGKVNTASFPQLIGKGSQADQTYNDWQVGCQFVVVEEVRDNMDAADFYHGYETFKGLVDTRVVSARVNPKYGKTRNDVVYFNCLIFSNHTDAIIIPEGDRRVCVLTNPVERRDYAYYERIEKGDTDAEAAALYWWLKRRDVGAYDHVYPPMTDAKLAMIGASLSAGDEIERAVLDDWSVDLVTKADLVEAVRVTAQQMGDRDLAGKPEATARRLWKRLGSLRPSEKNGARYVLTAGAAQLELRAIRNRDQHRKTDARSRGLKEVYDAAPSLLNNVVRFPTDEVKQ